MFTPLYRDQIDGDGDGIFNPVNNFITNHRNHGDSNVSSNAIMPLQEGKLVYLSATTKPWSASKITGLAGLSDRQ